MKNEPVVSYNHMEEDQSQINYSIHKEESENLPASLYMILVTDVLLMVALGVFLYKAMF